jgi:hypothetical protein
MNRTLQIVAAIIVCGGAVFAAGNRAAGSALRAAAQGGSTSGPFATKAVIEAADEKGAIPLKREEQVAMMFMDAVANIEGDCGRHAGHVCTLDELVAGPKSTDKWPIGKLKFDPRTADPNYTYKLTVDGTRWDVWASPKKPGFGGWYFVSKYGGIPNAYYNAAGPASDKDRQVTSRGVAGDSFVAR